MILIRNYTINIANGVQWHICADNLQAFDVVKALGTATHLEPGSAGKRKLVVKVKKGQKPLSNLSGAGPVVCYVPPPFNNDLLAIGMSSISLSIARETQASGGVLLHGGLVKLPKVSSKPLTSGEKNDGVLLGGSGGVGKTTATQRLPASWQALSDDASLVVRDKSGQYWAHPWPTWSRFYTIDGIPGPGGSWDVQRAVPLRAIFILSRSSVDKVESLSFASAITMLMELVQNVSHPMTRYLTDEEKQTVYYEQLMAVEAIVATIPVFTLYISLTGAFWEEIENTLSDIKKTNTSKSSHRLPFISSVSDNKVPGLLNNTGIKPIAYTGPSMNPTLREPDLLTVVPYDGPIRCGDVVFFQSPEHNYTVVHRVMNISPEGIRTRGDNNRLTDPYQLQPDNIIGRVVTARRGIRSRRIAGGRLGKLTGAWCQLRLSAFRNLLRPLQFIYHQLAASGLFSRLLPSRLQPRLFLFKSRHQSFLKLMIKHRVVGQYDTLKRQWRIHKPFRLFVATDKLPCPDHDDHL